MKILTLFLLILFIPFLLFSNGWLNEYWNLSHYKPGGVTLRDVARTGDYSGWAVGDSGKVFKLGYACVEDSFILLNGQYDFYGVSFSDVNHGWICGNKHNEGEEGVLLITTDGGYNWSDFYPTVGSNILAFYDVAFWNADTGYLGCSDGYVLMSTDGGYNWTKTLTKPYQPPSNDSTICIIHIEVTSEDSVWCVGDNMGVLAHSTNSGDNWNTRQPFDTLYDDLPDPDPPELYHGKMANFVICPNNPDNLDYAMVGLSHGRYGWTPDGGLTWYVTPTPSGDQWLYATETFAQYDNSLYGSSGSMYYNWISNKLHYTKDYDLLGCPTNDYWVRYVVGSSESILFFTEYGQDYGVAVVDMNLVPIYSGWYTDSVNVWWRVWSSSPRYITCHIHASLCQEGPYKEIKEIPLAVTQGYTWWNWVEDILPDPPAAVKRWYYVSVDEGKDYQQEKPILLVGQTIDTTSYITNFQATDPWVDNGWRTHLTWNYDYIPTATFYLYKEPNRMSERSSFIDSTTAKWRDDNLALTGYPFTYKVRRKIQGAGGITVAYSNAEEVTGSSHDEVMPDTVHYLYYWYDPQNTTLYVIWEALQDSTLGGYWFCPNLKETEQTHSLSQRAPITRTWYKDYYIDWPTGDSGLVAVCAMDRSYNVGPWNDKYIPVALTTASNLNATYANNGERLQRDVNGHMYLAFTSGNPDSIYFSQSTDGGAHWTKEPVAEGSYPVLMLYGSYLHLLWIKDKTTDQAKLMYSWKSISGEGFSTGSCLLNINADPTIESMGPPSLAISQDSLFVTWESRMSPPLSFYSGLFVGTLPNTRAASPPIHYEMLGLGSLLHTICPSETDTIMESVCPSTSVDKKGNPYIIWDRINPNTGFFDIVAWERTDDGDWFSGVISNTADCADEEEPYLTYENGVLHCVWSGTENNGGEPFNIYHSQKYPGQPNERWGEPEIVYNSEFNSSTPVYERGHIIWSEDEKNIMMVQYDYDDLEWQTSPPETIAKADNEWNVNPVATSGNGSLFIVWSNKDKFNNYYIHYDEKPILEISPHYAVNTGLEEEGAFTVERDGNQTLGKKYYKTIDHSTTNLIYKIRGLDEKPGQDLKLIFYHEFNDAIKLKVEIDHIWMNIWVQPAEIVSVEEMIPVSCLGDGEINIAIKSVPPTQNAPAVCSAIWIYDETGGGGPMSSGEGETPFIYSLKTPSPSPFKDNTTIYYSIAKSGKVSLKVYDITGRCINVLENGIKDPGVYSVGWNGCDNNNRKVATGVYFTRLTSRNFTSVRKVILVR